MVAQRLVCRSAENSYAIGTPLSNSADTNREYAYFRAVGSFYPTEMTGVLGLEPTECWKAGDSFERRGRILRWPSSYWKLDSGCNDTEEFDAHVNALLARLRRHREGLLRAINIAKLQFVCVGFYYQNFSGELNF